MRFSLPAIIILGVVFLSGCGRRDSVWSASYNFPASRWESADRAVFVPDTVTLENNSFDRMVVSLRYGEDATVEEFKMVVDIDNPDSVKEERDTVSVQLLPRKERTASNARLGVFELCDTLMLPEKAVPGWSVSFYPAGNNMEIEGIYSITVEL